MKYEINKRKTEYISYMIFIVSSFIVCAYHEPWFDEAQAWQIAKCASYKDILFYIPHYEGHPPLWTLILSIPAKLGVPYEVGLKTVGLTISFINAYLIIFKSPFPKIVRLLLPFNYFLFYQYGVIVRPYGLIILFMLLLAVLFPTKDEHPWRFTGILMLLCLTHAYGIMIAGGIAVCMVWDLWKEKGIKGLANSIFKDQRIASLAVLLLLAIAVIIDIFPKDDTYTASVETTNSLFSRLLCMLFTMLPDCLIFKSEWFSQDATLLKYAYISPASLISACLVGLFLCFILWLLGSKHNFKYLAFPYCFFAIFGAGVYMTAHHIGVSLGILIFWLWIDFEDEDRFENWNVLKAKLKSDPLDSKIIRNGIILIGVICLFIPIYWTISSSVKDIKEEYGYGRELASFIKENHLDDLNIFTVWDSDLLVESTDEERVFVSSDPTYLAYFDENIVENVPDADQAYKLHKNTSQTEVERIVAEWSEMDAPDLILGNFELSYNSNICSHDMYTVVYLAHANYYYKDGVYSGTLPVYMKNDLLDVYGLEEIDTSDMLFSLIHVSDEIMEAYRNGEITIEEYVDATLGDWGKTED